MSLDVYLTIPGEKMQRERSGIFIRENGETREISREDWNSRNPGHEPAVAREGPEETGEVFTANVTHNLCGMASAAGIYKHLWRPDEIGISKAKDLIEPLRTGIAAMEADPEKFIALEPANKWGTYENFVPWLRRYLDACESYPDADITVRR